MRDGSAIPGEEAAAWLKDHFAGDPEPEISLTWMVGESSPAVYQEVMEILFSPHLD